jgi:hypothetical protein
MCNNINYCVECSTIIVGAVPYMGKERGYIYKGLIPNTVCLIYIYIYTADEVNPYFEL